MIYINGEKYGFTIVIAGVFDTNAFRVKYESKIVSWQLPKLHAPSDHQTALLTAV